MGRCHANPLLERLGPYQESNIQLVEIEAAFENHKMTWLYGPFFTNLSIGLKRTFLWPLSPTVCT
jgi:hypothetical protein